MNMAMGMNMAKIKNREDQKLPVAFVSVIGPPQESRAPPGSAYLRFGLVLAYAGQCD